MSGRHRPVRWWKDEDDERAAYDERTAYRETFHRMLLWDGDDEPACIDCGHRIGAHTAVAFVNREPVPLVWHCGAAGCECETERLTWSDDNQCHDGAEGGVMNLYLLQRKVTGYDEAKGFVVRAETEYEARSLAADRCGDEGRIAWIEPEQSRCVRLYVGGAPGVVLRDFNGAG